jgi:tight adherence protein B
LVFALTKSILFTVIASIIAWLFPTFILRARIKKRVKSLNEQLSDAIVLISNSLKAGYSFFQAVDIVAKEMTGPIAEEFALLQKEVNLGLTTEKALENLVARVKSDDLELVVIAVLIQRQVGGNLSEILDNISSTIRERVKIKGEVKTVTAQGRASGFIISLLPVGLGLILFVINPEHISTLFTDPIGIAILVFSVMMELIGIYFISKIVKIEI